MPIGISLNMEYIRSEDKSFKEGAERAAQIGYKYIEPLVHNGRELLSEGGFFHSFSMDDDPLEMKEILDANGLKCCSLSAHSPLMRPEIAVNYMTRAIRFAAAVGTNIINSDEGPKPEWLPMEEIWDVMKYSIRSVTRIAEKWGVYVAIEPHQIVTKKTEGLLKLANLVDSPMLKINYDTGNAYLAGEDPYEGLKASMSKLVHIHAKDISFKQSDAERGKVTGTPVGCACGEGVIDWTRVIQILHDGGFDGFLSVECGTSDQAVRSLAHLSEVIEKVTGKAAAHA